MTGRTGRRSSRDRKQKSALGTVLSASAGAGRGAGRWLRNARSAIDLEKRRGNGDVHWSDQTLPDHARPLAPRGRRDAKRIAKHLRRRGIEPMLVLCSSAERTRETLELVRPALGGAPVQIEDGLYAAANDELLERLRVLPERSASVLVIGHN